MNVDLTLVSFVKMYTYESLAPFQLKHEFTMVVEVLLNPVKRNS
jgi:hypothetical protein